MKKSILLVHASLLAVLTVFLSGCGPNLFDKVGNFWSLSCCGVVVVILDIIALLEIAGSNRSTGDKVLWIALIIFFPIVGFVFYYFFGRR